MWAQLAPERGTHVHWVYQEGWPSWAQPKWGDQ